MGGVTLRRRPEGQQQLTRDNAVDPTTLTIGRENTQRLRRRLVASNVRHFARGHRFQESGERDPASVFSGALLSGDDCRYFAGNVLTDKSHRRWSVTAVVPNFNERRARRQREGVRVTENRGPGADLGIARYHQAP